MFIHKLTLAFTALVLSVSAFAQAAKVTAVSGDVTYTVGKVGAPVKVAIGSEVPAGAVLNTAAKSSAVMRFQDGGSVALAENTNFNLIAFNYNAAKPAEGSSAFDLIRGAFRFVTGAMGAANPSAVRITSGTATVGIRGTDIVVASTLAGGGTTTVSIQVINGAVTFTTSAGSITLGVGGIGQIGTAVVSGAAAGAPSVAAAFNAIGVNAQALMTQLTTQTMSGALITGSATGVTTGAAGVATATTATTTSIVAATAAGVAGVISANTESATQHTTTTHH
jgi:FecR protein